MFYIDFDVHSSQEQFDSSICREFIQSLPFVVFSAAYKIRGN